jgi:hypothetical protein
MLVAARAQEVHMLIRKSLELPTADTALAGR